MTFYEYKTLSGQKGWKFNVVSDRHFKNIQYIHPLKQKIIADIVEKAKNCPEIKRLIVFGSSITNKCDFQSDLDICIDWNIDCVDSDGVFVPETFDFMNFVSMITKGHADMVHYQYLEGTLIKDAVEEGVEVYVSHN